MLNKKIKFIFILTTYLALLVTSTSVLAKKACDPFPLISELATLMFTTTYRFVLPWKCPYKHNIMPISDFIQFYFIKPGEKCFYSLPLDDPNLSEIIKPDEPCTIFVHGYIDSTFLNENQWMEESGKALASTMNNGTVILMDWGKISSCNYRTVADAIAPNAGRYLAEFIRKFKFDLDQVKLIGHSVGAHICGIAGAALNGEVGQILGLDPAGPLFTRPTYKGPSKGLNQSCAQYVQALHTDRHLFGTNQSMGHADFFPNIKSYAQPGCTKILVTCNHSRAVFINFAAIFIQKHFVGINCATNNQSDSSRFGIHNVDRNSGTFCFETTSCFPYITLD